MLQVDQSRFWKFVQHLCNEYTGLIRMLLIRFDVKGSPTNGTLLVGYFGEAPISVLRNTGPLGIKFAWG